MSDVICDGVTHRIYADRSNGDIPQFLKEVPCLCAKVKERT